MKRFKRLLILLLLTGITIYGLARLGDVEINAETVARVNWGWILLAMLLYFSTIAVRGTRWHRILKAMGWSTKLLYTSTLLIAGLFISAILPARVGDVGRIALLKQDCKIPISQGLASIAAERALDIFAILTIAVGGLLWVLPGQLPAQYSQVIIGSAILFLVGLIGLFTVPSLERWLRNPFHWQEKFDLQPKATSESQSRSQKAWRLYQKTLDFGFSIIRGVQILAKSPLSLAIALIESFYIWFLDALLIYFSLVSIEALAPMGISVFSMTISNLIAAVPLTPGAIGQFDAALLGLLTLFGVPTADASLGVILLRLLSLITFIPIGGLITYIFGFSRAFDINPSAINPQDPTSGSPLSAPNPVEG